MALEYLAAYIHDRIRKNGGCVLYGDRLAVIFADDGDTPKDRQASLKRFAAENGWHVETRDQATVALFVAREGKESRLAAAAPLAASSEVQKEELRSNPRISQRIFE